MFDPMPSPLLPTHGDRPASDETTSCMPAGTPSFHVQGWRNNSRCGGGLGLGGHRVKGSPSISKGPKPPIQLLQLLKNSQKEVKRAHFVIYWVPPGSLPGNGINGARRGRSLPAPPPPGFSSHAHVGRCSGPILRLALASDRSNTRVQLRGRLHRVTNA